MKEMANLRKNKRKTKRYCNQMQKKLAFGKFFLDCRYHPCVVEECNIYSNFPYDSEINGKSLIDGTGTSCSLMYCRPEPLSEAVAREGAKVAKEKGFEQYLLHLGMSQEGVDWYKQMKEDGWKWT